MQSAPKAPANSAEPRGAHRTSAQRPDRPPPPPRHHGGRPPRKRAAAAHPRSPRPPDPGSAGGPPRPRRRPWRAPTCRWPSSGSRRLRDSPARTAFGPGRVRAPAGSPAPLPPPSRCRSSPSAGPAQRPPSSARAPRRCGRRPPGLRPAWRRWDSAGRCPAPARPGSRAGSAPRRRYDRPVPPPRCHGRARLAPAPSSRSAIKA